jgi:hypothetical protein
MLAKLNGWGKVAIGTRMNDRCDPLFFNCWSRMIASGLRSGDTLLDAAVELPQHFAATALASFFLKSDADTLLMVDTDQVFKPDTLSRLRDDFTGFSYDILCALAVARRNPFYPIVLGLRPDPGDGKCDYKCLKDDINGKVIEVDTVGTGFTLIRRSVFDKMQSQLGIDKWFFEFGDGGLGEDTRFCQRAKQCGCKIGVHTGIGIGHRGPITFLWDVENKKTVMESYDQVRDLLTKQ